MADTIKVTLVKVSYWRSSESIKKLWKLWDLPKCTRQLKCRDNAATRGMIKQVQHLVKVEE